MGVSTSINLVSVEQKKECDNLKYNCVLMSFVFSAAIVNNTLVHWCLFYSTMFQSLNSYWIRFPLMSVIVSVVQVVLYYSKKVVITTKIIIIL